ncbi:MAG TPA: putative metal-dependent hydrolase [Gemmatimonadales bacterium]|nr:putative metal-dependent hydrolase [Gemmatimonadales bacterium]
MADLRYPIGPFVKPDTYDAASRSAAIDRIASVPRRLRGAVDGLGPPQLDTQYRPGGWTVRQVVHHLPDSHMNSYVRFKRTLTEDQPVVCTYHEDRWAELPDEKTGPIEASLDLLEALHVRWVLLLRSLTPDHLARTLDHPEIGILSLDAMLALYAWHGDHHIAHITSLREREGW